MNQNWLKKIITITLAIVLLLGTNVTASSALQYSSKDLIAAKEVSYVSIAKMPYRTSYGVGETFNPYGLSVKVLYTDGTSQIVSSGFPKYIIAITDTYVTFRVNGYPVSIPITVISKTDQSEVRRDKISIANNVSVHRSYVKGYEDGTFAPSKTLTRAEALTMLCGIVGNPPVANSTAYTNPYSNVTKKNWYYPYVGFLCTNGVISAADGEEFKPSEPITRAEFALYVSRFKKYTPATTQVFTDVPSTHWAAEEINAVYQNGWITGYADKTFNPTGSLTRAEAVTILNRMQNRKIDATSIVGQNIKFYRDVPTSHWAYFDIIEASTAHKLEWKKNKEVWTSVD